MSRRQRPYIRRKKEPDKSGARIYMANVPASVRIKDPYNRLALYDRHSPYNINATAMGLHRHLQSFLEQPCIQVLKNA